MNRFSLRALLACLAVVAVCVGFATLQSKQSKLLRENELLQQQVSTYQRELGHIEVSDPNLVHLIHVPGQEAYVWRWRIYAPKGTEFVGGIATENIPKNDVPLPTFECWRFVTRSEGTLVTATISRDIDDGYELKLDLGDGNVYRAKTLLPRSEWLDVDEKGVIAGDRGPLTYTFGEPIRLLCKRGEDSFGRQSGMAEARGLLFWIKPNRPDYLSMYGRRE